MAAGYVLHGDRRSGSAAVEMVLAEIGVPFDKVEVPLEGEAQLAAEHRRVNPMGRVPVLVLPGGEAMTESAAILVNLALRHPEAGLLPEEDPARARALRWLALLAGEYYPHVTRSDYPERFSADPAHAPAIRARAREMGRDIWRLVERDAFAAPGEGPHLLGARFTLVDPYIATLSQWMDGAGWVEAECPRIAACTRAVAARPKAGPVWRAHFG